MILWLFTAALAQDAPWEERLPGAVVDLDAPGTAFGVEGVDIAPIGGSSGLSVSQASVLGSDGGTHAWTARGRVAWDRYQVMVGVPVASYRTPDTRTAGLGNLRADVMLLDDAASPAWQMGVSAHAPAGRTYTWVNDAEELWSGFGIDAVYQRSLGDGPTHGAVRTAVGIHGPAAYAPFPEVYGKVDLAGLVEQDLGDRVGLLAEGSFSWWDVSPIDVSALIRVDPVDGLRVRGGITVPLASWAGWQPAAVPAGVRETTLRLEIHTAH